ncbi:YihY/virulence factor BrkB family protein [Candidatus Bathycorpusculum sp.]|uniref:YihY/virulence factor BrkB family protein n=1 Tax=Candidatus Bathycorpusculum sp. TaxID=2994959 RepID=UPI00281FD42C|nr:YihY/virulence factor BrkB family protein [Candidatus Termitimicrobium sp.]MCL2686622.1 YihY/virulence factor BrkB family protein [Candidatus Termitimicrobium sp.]
MKLQIVYGVFKTALIDWLDDNAVLRSAALTFFIILPLPTLLLIVTAIFGLFLGEQQAIQVLVQQISAVVGPAVADLFSQLIKNTGSPFTSVWTAIVVVGFSIGGAIGAFSVLSDTINCIWDIELPKRQPFWRQVKQKIRPFAVVSMLGLIVIAWTSITQGLVRAITMLSGSEILILVELTVTHIMLSFGVTTLLLAIIYKALPETMVQWRDVSLAAVTTGVAFTLTNYIFGTYIQVFTVTTVAGTAGSLLIILLWIFILNQIVLFGAEISKVYATTVGSHKTKPA